MGARGARRARARARGAGRAEAGASIYLDEASVTGTETALLAAAARRGLTEIRHAATASRTSSSCASSCAAMGVGIEGAGTPTIRVEGGARSARRDAPALTATTSRPAAGRSSAPSPAAKIEIGGARAVDMEVVAAVLRR